MLSRRPVSLLLAAALVLALTAGPTACTGAPAGAPPPPETAAPSPSPTPTDTATATLSPTAAASPAQPATPTPSATATTAPSPTPRATSTTTATPARTPTAPVTQTPAPTATPSSTPTATPAPSPSPTATPAPLITARDLGIRRVDTAEVLAAAGLRHVRYTAGEEVPWEAGLLLLDVATGEVEGWVVSEGDSVDEEGTAVGTVSGGIRLSPGNRFLLLPGGALHDRMTGRTFEGVEVIARSSYPNDLVGWGSGPDERLILRSSARQAYVVVDGDMQATALLADAALDLLPDSGGRYLFAHDRSELQLFDLMHASGGALTPSFTWPLDWVTWSTLKGFDSAWVVPFHGGIAVINAIDAGTCRIALYRVDGRPPADHRYPCWQDYGPPIDISPDGRFVAIARSGIPSDYDILPQVTGISVFDAASGEELLRIKGGGQPGRDSRLDGSWLADSSGIVVGTSRGVRLVTLAGQWGSAPGLPAPDHPGVFVEETTVRNREGRVLATLDFGPPGREIRGLRSTRVGWGSTSQELRVTTGIFYESGFRRGLHTGAAIERPPFDDRLLVEVVVDTCLNLREEPSLDAPVLTCLPEGAVVETEEYQPGWMHIRTDDGIEGWASAEYLRWYSDGVRLEEAPGPFTTVAVGGDYAACALTEAGKAMCWNANDPLAVGTLPGRYIAIDAAEGTTCAVAEDGEAVCWGSDAAASEAPPGRYTAISTTSGYTCALREDGEAACWGAHSARAREQEARAGDVGQNWPLGWMPDPPPGRYVAITVGYSNFLDGSLLSACAAKAGGGFVCWRSSGKYDPLGPGETWQVDHDAAERVARGDFCSVNGFGYPDCTVHGSAYTAISAGRSHTCAITPTGAARCWASGSAAAASGALSVMHPPDPSPARYVSISTDGSYACAVTDAGHAVCWTSERNVTTAPPVPAPGRYVAVSDGRSHTCALTEDGEAVCWGWNNHGQTSVPPGRYKAISAGEFHTCALTLAGEALCWGEIFPRAPDGQARPFRAVATGSYEYGGAACALTEAGEATCWGGEPSRREAPAGRYVAIDVGERQSCALTEAGEVACWDRHGGRDSPAGRYTAIDAGSSCGLTDAGEILCWGHRRPGMDAPPGRYSALAVGWQHACALTNAGEAVCWAWASSRNKAPPEPSPYEDRLIRPPSGPLVSISSSEYRSCAVTLAGEAVCWGDVEYTILPSWLSLE